MTRKFFTQVDLTGIELNNVRIQNLTTDPTPFGKGHIYFNTVANELRWYTGTSWVPVADATDVAAVTAALAQEVTNRTTAVTAEATTRATNDAANLVTAKDYADAGLSLKSNTASPTFTGTVSIPTLAVTTTATGITKAMVGLANVDNTSDVNKPVSTAQQTALNLKADLASPALTGVPTSTTAAVDTSTTQIATTAYVVGQAYAKLASPALTGTPTSPTAAAGTNTTQIATTAFVGSAVSTAVTNAVSSLVNGAPAALDTLNELATALNNDAALSTTLTNSIATKLPLAGGTMTGIIVGKKITTDFYALDYNDVPHKGAMSDAINGGVGYGIGIAQAYTDTSVTTAIANEVLDRNVNIANAKNEAVGISQTYTNTRETAEIAARNTAIATSLTTAQTYTDTRETAEIAARNTAISSAITTEVTDRNTAIAANSVTDKAYTDTKVATEVTDRNAAIATETSNRGTAISSAISTEVTNRTTAIAAEAALRITGDATSLASANTYTDGKFSALTTTAVPEGTNLYYTQERVQDEISSTLVTGSNLTGTYSDTAGTYTLSLSNSVVITDGTQTLTNKTLTNPYINDTVVLLASSTELNLLDGATVSTAEINKLAGLTATTEQLNFVTGVTSAIQAQFSSKSDTSHTHSFQAASNELTALAGLTGIGFIKRTGTGTYAIDTSAYALATSPTINTSIISGTTSFNLVNTLATTINFGGAATTMAIGSNDATAVLTLNAPTVKGNLAYVNLYNTVATTVNFAGAATSLTIGGTPTGAVTHNYSTNPTSSGVTKTVNLATGSASGSVTVVNVGSTTDGATSSLNVKIPAAFTASTTVPYPVSGSDAANKEYVDNIASGLIIKNQVVYTTSANLSSVYTNGTSDSTGGTGVGAKLTAAVNGALVLDGVGVTTNQRVLVKDQTNALENGIYVVTNAGDAVTQWILTRATDFNGNLNAGTIKPGNYIFVTSGTYLANSSWIMSNAGTSVITSGAIKVGTDPINLAQYSGTPLNISTLGNVSIGTWQATPIAEPYIDPSIARLASPTFTGHVHVPVVPVDNADATSKKYVDDLIFASLPYLPDIIPLDDLRYIFDDRESRFEPRHQGVKVPLYNPLRLMINLNGVVQTPSYPEYVWQSMLPLDGFMLDNDGYIAFTQVPPAGSTFDGRVMLGPNVNTVGKAYPFRAMDILLGS